jgi:hypothetical protein
MNVGHNITQSLSLLLAGSKADQNAICHSCTLASECILRSSLLMGLICSLRKAISRDGKNLGWRRLTCFQGGYKVSKFLDSSQYPVTPSGTTFVIGRQGLLEPGVVVIILS